VTSRTFFSETQSPCFHGKYDVIFLPRHKLTFSCTSTTFFSPAVGYSSASKCQLDKRVLIVVDQVTTRKEGPYYNNSQVLEGRVVTLLQNELSRVVIVGAKATTCKHENL
jgi:hypothetical protein